MRSIGSLFHAVEKRVKVLNASRKDFTTPPPPKKTHTHDYQHVIVFESADWGSIRMSDRKSWEALKGLGFAVDKRPYERYDTLESKTDLEALFEILIRHKDSQGNHPVLTANMLMANPNFEAIQKNNYSQYEWEPIQDTYTRYYGDSSILQLMRQGFDAGIFMPQSHGREHFNTYRWLEGLQQGNQDMLTAFQYGMCGVAPLKHPERGNHLMNALLAINEKEQQELESAVLEGLQLFQNLWGFKSKTFVAPCYLWNEGIERVLALGGVQLIQTSRTSKPCFGAQSRCFYSGQRNDKGQYYSIRNCRFEPATKEGGMNAESLMQQVDNTFKKRKLAVFSTHRINYVGGIDEQNRKNTLRLLDDFLTKLLHKYPDVVFLSSDKLIDIFKNNEDSYSSSTR